jgi:hypothetical protein
MENLASQGGFQVQESMRLGTGRDIYYYTRDTVHKQSIPTVVDNRFKQALTSLAQGSNTFIISVDQGISDILFYAKLPEAGGSVDYDGLALPRGWLYQLINRISIRYSGSSQYFWTGAQCLIENLREMPNPTTRDQLFQLGGSYLNDATAGAEFEGDNLYAYAYLNFPHDSPNGSMLKPNPFPSELLSQPIVVTLELASLPSIFSSSNALGDVSGAPRQLETGGFQVKQVHAMDRGDLMVSMADRSKAYSFPTKAFYQNEITVALPASGQSQQNVLLTGFRAGQVRSIIMWLTDDADTSPATNAPFVKNYTNFALPHDVQLLYNGTVYYDAPGTSSQFWNLVSTETPSVLNASVLGLSGGAIVPTEKSCSWVEIPFSQVFEQLSGSHMYVAGKQIMNAVVNLTLSVPDPTKSYTLHAVYAYNCVMMTSMGSVDYVF